MIAGSRISDGTDDTDTPTFVYDPDTEPPAGHVEPVTPAEAERQQILSLTPSPARLATIAGGAAAIVGGGAIGYWLGRRSAMQARRTVGRTAATFESAAKLAPVAMHLLANPLVRALAVRMLVRQLSRRVQS